MCRSRSDKNRRILVIDDSRTIHDDVRDVFGAKQAHAVGRLRRADERFVLK
ncbi:MAG: hypothetical protein ABII12_13075 [Planctomycetota bacterium]